MRPGRLLQVLLFAAAAVTAGHAGAQSMSPMRGTISSFTEEFAVRVFPRNPYRHPIQVAIRVYDQDFRPIPARISPPTMKLAAGAARSVVVVIPFGRNNERRVRVCTESVPFPDQKTRIRAQICGRFLARRLR
ncbi:hypothetical protein [Chelativorans sp. Marseille-P2723]|uniref:hypothetical protein n=1 Tax=Chelativorans sp. Marseille-P2723 TaxID=2709133 RepID=UPI001570016E|nr:hypothetical protein [Chelativorans sp. Marseille-P2723]